MPSQTIAKLVGAGLLRRVPWAGDDDTALRTTHKITFGERLDKLNRFVDGWKANMAGDPSADSPVPRVAPPPSLFNGSASDFAKQVGWKSVANALREKGCLSLTKASQIFEAKDSSCCRLMETQFFPETSLPASSPTSDVSLTPSGGGPRRATAHRPTGADSGQRCPLDKARGVT